MNVKYDRLLGELREKDGGLDGTGSAGSVTFYIDDVTVGYDTNFFYDSDTERLGVGTNAPQTKFHIVENSSETQLRVESTNAGGKAYYRANAGNSSVNATFGTDTTSGFFWVETNHPFIIATNSVERVRVHASGGVSVGSSFASTDPGAGKTIIAGNLGVGSASPSQELHVKSVAGDNADIRVESGDGAFFDLFAGSNGTGFSGLWAYGSSNPLAFATDATERMRITTSMIETKLDIKFNATNTTGSGSASLGSNSPASTPSAPYTWIKIITADGSTAYIPAWK